MVWKFSRQPGARLYSAIRVRLRKVMQQRVQFEVAVVGGGPAGLSGAITLGRARRRVVLFDDGRPRNEKAQGVHCFLGSEGIKPSELRARGRADAEKYGVELIDSEVLSVRCSDDGTQRRFIVKTHEADYEVRALLLATGIRDVLPDIPNISDFYGESVHHCPYCDGWEESGRRIATVGKNPIDLAVILKSWSDDVVVCSNGDEIEHAELEKLSANNIPFFTEKIESLVGSDRRLREIRFAGGSSIKCDAIFFSSDQQQRSEIPSVLGCECDEKGHTKTDNTQCTNIEGVFLAGDADGEVQFAIVAAAEGATAGVMIDRWLRSKDQKS